jgi:hypothetical protein
MYVCIQVFPRRDVYAYSSRGGREIMPTYPGAFTPDVNSVLNENLGGILGGILGGRYSMLI